MTQGTSTLVIALQHKCYRQCRENLLFQMVVLKNAVNVDNTDSAN